MTYKFSSLDLSNMWRYFIMKHALVVGGSGMLAKTSLWLAANGYLTSVLGRDEKKLNKLVKSNSNISPISVDYNKEDIFREEIKRSITNNGPYELVIAWIHRNEEEIIRIISSEIENASTNEWQLFHVLGSSGDLDQICKTIDISEKCLYHQVQLGFVVTGNRSRWLTHDEISNGVIASIQNKLKRFVVGTLEPWEKRP
jgi:hypothetical protein